MNKAQSTACSLRDSVWGSRGLPVDPVWIAGQLGLDVVNATLPTDVSGALIKEAGQDPVILLASNDSKVRKRFSCAHELGHYAYRMDGKDASYEYVDFRGQTASQGTSPEEIFANQFAAELLMPAVSVKALHKEGMSAVLMAQKFGVSDDAIRFRLINLGLQRSR